MTITTRKIASLLGLLCMAAIPAAAQYEQNINVEGKYVPDFIPRDRISTFPATMKFLPEQSTLPYSFDGVDADFKPNPLPIPASGWQSTRKPSDHRGYLELGLGSWLESTLSAGYRIIDRSDASLGIRLQHNSTSLWKADLSPSTADTRMKRYDSSLGIYGHRDFEGAGRLEASGGYHLGYFNYYGFNPAPLATDAVKAPTQTLNDAAARIGWSSERGESFTWNIGAGARYFALRRLYLAGSDPVSPDSYTGGKETDINLAGNVDYSFGSSAIGLDLDSHLFLYGGYESRGGVSLSAPVCPDTYGALSLTPYYTLTQGRLSLRAGVVVDLAFNAGMPQEHYRTASFAPDVSLDFNAGPVALFLRAEGGNELHTLAGDWQECYYQVPAIMSTRPSYTPIDAKAGFSFGPFSGFRAGFDFSYRITFDQDYFGWYQTMMGGPGALAAIGLPSQIDGESVTYFDDLEPAADVRGFSLGLDMGYDAGRYFRIDARGTWQPQNEKTGFYNGMDRPEWTAAATIVSNPWRTLKLTLGCDWRGNRAFPALGQGATGEHTYFYKVPDWLSLNLGAAYDFTDWFGIWVQADNLTCRRNILAPGLPMPGISVVGGVSLLF